MTAEYISDKCGSVTIRVNNNQFPLMPLFSPVYSTTRPYSQTRSNTQRALMQPDEIQRMDNKQCIVLLRGQKPMLLYKIIPDEFPAFQKLRPTPVAEHIPEWRARFADEAERPPEPPGQEAAPPDAGPAPQPAAGPPVPPTPGSEPKPQSRQDEPEPRFDYDFSAEEDLGMVEKGVDSVLGEDEPEE